MSFLRHLSSIKAAWAAETRQRKAGRKQWDETEFLAAALEVTETPPPPLGRILLWLIVVAALLAIAWAALAKVDTVAVAEGRLVPSGRLRSVEAADPGIVQRIAVREGDHVQAGQVLIALDPTVADADADSAQAELETAALASERAKALLGQSGRFNAPAGSSHSAVQAERQAVDERRLGYQARIANMVQRRAAAQASVRVIEANIAKLQQTIPLAERQVKAYETLAAQGYGSQIRLDQERERLIGMQRGLDAEKARADEARAQVLAMSSESAQANAEFRGQAAKERAEAEGVVATRSELVRKAQQRSGLQSLRAPVSGTVQEVAVTTLGQVVEAGKPLVTVVPDGEPLVVEVLMLDRDVGAVKPGDPVVVKLEAYPFTRFGTLTGRVSHVSPDSIVDDKRGLVFPARVTLDVVQRGKARALRLSPGMSAIGEIITGHRRVIEYLWSPIAKATSEAGRER